MNYLIGFLAGVALGALTIWSHVWAGSRLRSATGLVWVMLGVLLRLLLIGGFFVVALRIDVYASLMAFVGLMLSRWVLIYLVHREQVFTGLLEDSARGEALLVNEGSGEDERKGARNGG